MIVYVTMQPHLDSSPGSTVYALVLPYRGKWEEVESLPSALEGFGVFPRNTPRVNWADLTEPLLMCARTPRAGVRSPRAGLRTPTPPRCSQALPRRRDGRA